MREENPEEKRRESESGKRKREEKPEEKRNREGRYTRSEENP